jgi:cation diffusion facilitator family transporter
MIGLLEHIFIKNKEELTQNQIRTTYGILCGSFGVFLNICLFFGKLFAGIISHSIAITADAFNNLSDAGSSIVTLIGFKLAGEEPDQEHPFGHGRMEYVSGFVVSMLILWVGFEFFKSSINKIIHPEVQEYSRIVLVILVVSVLVKGYMWFYNRRVGKKIQSLAMETTAMDSLSDAVATTVVLFGTLVARISGWHIDGYLGVAVSVFIFLAGINAAKETLHPLLGTTPEPEFVSQIEEIVLSYETVIGIHDLLVHNYGPGRCIISLHAEVPSDGDILAMHDTIDLIERQLSKELSCVAVIHMDPICVHDETTNRLKKVVWDVVEKIDESLTIHDFRVVIGNTHTNLIFDVVVPYGFRLSDDAIKEAITEGIREYDDSYFAVIEVDKKCV